MAMRPDAAEALPVSSAAGATARICEKQLRGASSPSARGQPDVAGRWQVAREHRHEAAEAADPGGGRARKRQRRRRRTASPWIEMSSVSELRKMSNLATRVAERTRRPGPLVDRLIDAKK